MKRFIFIGLILCGLAGCADVKTFEYPNTDMPFAYKSRIGVKDYKILGRVRGNYARYCFLFGIFCTGDLYPYDDLMTQAEKKGGNSVINFVVDQDSSSPFWSWLYYRRTMRANGMAVKIYGDRMRVTESFSE